MISAEEYFKKEYDANHLKRCIELNDVQSIYSLMEEFADNTKPVKSVVLDLVSKRFRVTYYSCDQALSVIIEAETFNKAMIEFATYYHEIDEVYGMIEV